MAAASPEHVYATGGVPGGHAPCGLLDARPERLALGSFSWSTVSGDSADGGMRLSRQHRSGLVGYAVQHRES
ncbi:MULTISPECIES: hypothetical protein [Micromonospora]|uniref:Uncharacterized protein n=1 Tax=Micromonospora yangpuensis TaxID=683228 RepID=A0A1C6UCW3_9ACTN|nr:hypothetical protein [Micromonospora yangpuensis]SCL51886.1 hypothetical protein GA0070617_1913 [Micromonospora yangpuensis]